MNPRRLHRIGRTWLVVAGCLVAAAAPTALARQTGPPNFIFIFCDNLGYGDTEPFGSRLNRTPSLNRMAREGRKFTDFSGKGQRPAGLVDNPQPQLQELNPGNRDL